MLDFKIFDRDQLLFCKDKQEYDLKINEIVKSNRFLVIGGGGTIGQAITKELFKRGAKAIHVVDLSENYLVELVRDIRSSHGYLVDDFDTFAIDCGEPYFEQFMAQGRYDYVLNLSAMKHVRSESSAFGMYRMLHTNVINTIKTYDWAQMYGVKKYFCVSTDKATNPANFMGATKRAMELCVMSKKPNLPISSARFANVAFSNGSLLEGFRYRIEKKQPLSAPSDISRFFITQEESGVICLFSAILGETNEIFFPSNAAEIKLITFKKIAENYVRSLGKEPVIVEDENQARSLMASIDLDRFWPINCFRSDTAGEKPFEEFFSESEHVDYGRYHDLATISFYSDKTETEVAQFLADIQSINLDGLAARTKFLEITANFVATFKHLDSDKFLNARM